MNSRLATALGLYLLIAFLATITLTGDFRLVVLALVAVLAVKTWRVSATDAKR
ncbi:MAG TPA: hypothetical protein VMZ52_14155 [Bryobacteraceae bacterium]|nr:hypothetical protein [Bryobacteraceae bacterium]